MLGQNRAAFLRKLLALPKAELHVHLDGSLRAETLVELAAEAGSSLPAQDPGELRRHMRADGLSNLGDYLALFETTLAVMQSADALERITFELIEDHAQENVRYVEVRYSPVLHTRKGMSLNEAIEAPLRGLKRGLAETGVQGGLILCGIRSMDPGTSLAIAQAAVAYRDSGVVGFDLAGPEGGFPASLHREAFDVAAAGDLPITVHAGEAAGPQSIRDALTAGHANRIGHGTRLWEDPELEALLRERRIPLEICLTSNVQTRATSTLREHPARRYMDEGLVLSFCTDSRLISGTTVTEEFRRAHDDLGFTWDELVAVARMGFESAFLKPEAKRDLLARFEDEVSSLESEKPRRSAPE